MSDMKFYHFTPPGTVLRVAAEGLKPNASAENAFLTAGVPAVWLTREQSNIVRDADVLHMKKLGCLDRAVGDFRYGGKARLTVRLARHNKRLMRYEDFLRKIGAEMAVARPLFTPSALQNWWVYLGAIPPHKIDCGMPGAVALECLDHHITTHPTAAFREELKALRGHIDAFQPGRLFAFDFNAPEGRLMPAGGRRSRDKGNRIEREIVDLHRAVGIHAERYPLSGASRFRGSGHDVDYVFGKDKAPLVAEVNPANQAQAL